MANYPNPPDPKPRISVIIHAYNHGRFIAECIESILAQTLTPCEIAICDDHSLDDTWKIAENYREKYPALIRTFRHEKNMGMHYNARFALQQVSGELVSSLDGDDCWLPEKLEKEWLALQKMPDARVAYSNVQTIDARGKITGVWYNGKGPQPPSGDVFPQVFAKRFFPNNDSVFRNQLVYRAALDEVGHQDPNIPVHIDWDLKIRLTSRFKVAYSGETLVRYRVHEAGIHATHRHRLAESEKAVINKNQHLIESRTPREQQYIRDGIAELLKKHPAERKNELSIPTGKEIIFLISLPRSGSTLLQRILGSHSQIHTVSEPWLMLHPLYALKRQGMQAEFEWTLARNALDDLMAQFPEGDEVYVRAMQAMADVIYSRLRELSGKPFFLDKTPRYYFIIPELARVFPEARFIFLQRNPLAVFSSILKSWFGNNPAQLKTNYNYTDLTRGPQLILDGMRRLQGRAFTLKYEDLVEQPGREIRQLCDRLSLPFEEAMIQYSCNLSGRYGDQGKIKQFTQPVSGMADTWLANLVSDSSLYRAALDYLDVTGEKIWAEFGYNTQELRDMLEKSRNNLTIHAEPKKDMMDEINLLREEGKLAEAAALVEKALQNEPENLALLNIQGELLIESGEVDAARLHFGRVLQRYPDDVNALNDLAVIYIMQNNFSEALQILKKILTLDAANEIARQNLEYLRSQFGDGAEAQKEVKDWPKISVITPSFNQGKYLEQTIQSVLRQNYPNFEHIVMDGGSGDETMEILKKYPHLLWKSEKDKGQSDAVNKALKMADGEIIAWINSDDWYEDGAFFGMAEFFLDNPDKNVVMGDCRLVNEKNEAFDTVINRERGFDEMKNFRVGRSIPTQPAIFFRRKLISQYGYLDESLYYAMDYDLWLRFALQNRFYHLDKVVAYYRFHNQAKGGDQDWSKFVPEWTKVSDKYQKLREAKSLISIIIPCYNYGKYLRQTVGSVLAQTYRNFEIVIVNDGSADNTQQVAGELINENPGKAIRLITQNNSGQPAISRNIGVAASCGEYILPLDGDDMLHPEMLEKCLTLLTCNSNVAIAYTDRRDFDGVDQVVPAGDYDFAKLKYANQISHCALYKKEVWEKVGGYRTNVRGVEDWDFWIAAGALGFTGQRIAEPLFWYRRHDTGVYQDAVKNMPAKFARIILNNAALYSEQEIDNARRYLGLIDSGNGGKHPLVSVIIPTYNRPEQVQQAVQSVLDQHYLHTEIIVVNDAGQPVKDIIEKLNYRQNIICIDHDRNQGLAASRNTGIRAAQGKYIALLDDDDIFYPTHIETAVEQLRQSKVVYTDAIRATFKKNGRGYEMTNFNIPYSMDFDRNKLLLGNISPVNCFVFERKLALEAGLFDETLSTLEDWEFWTRLSRRAQFRHVSRPTVQVNWRTDGSTMTSSRQAEFKANRERIYKKNAEDIKRIPNPNEILAEFTRIWSADASVSAHPEAASSADKPAPQVSIIMLTMNALEYTKKCLASIAAHTPLAHEIIFVDNASSDGTVEFLKSAMQQNRHYRLIENKTNRGFAAGNNQGVAAAQGEFVLLLNNDVLVGEGWLKSLVDALKQHEKIGAVGPIANSISGLQMVANVPYQDESGFPAFAAEVRKLNRGKLTPRRRIAGFAILMKKSVYTEIGGLDESFGNGNFEDDDLCLRLRGKGYAVMVDESTFIHHFGSQTFKANNIDYSTSLQEKGRRFREKWPQADYEELLEIKNPLAESHAEKMALAGNKLAGMDWTRARAIYDEILPENPLFVEALFGAALAARQLEDNNAALRYLQTLLQRAPDQAEAWNQLGLVYMALSDPNRAVEAFRTAIKNDSGHRDAWRNFGDVLIRHGRETEGLALFRKFLQVYPDDEAALLYLAYYHFERGQFTESKSYLDSLRKSGVELPAIAQLQHLLDNANRPTEPLSTEAPLTDPSPKANGDRLRAANLLLQDDDPEEARNLYIELLHDEPQNLPAFYGLGLTYQVQEKFLEANHIFMKILEYDVRFAPACTSLGVIAMIREDFAQAARWFRKSLETESDQPEVRRFLAEALIESGAYHEGVRLLFSLLEDNPDDFETLLLMANVNRDIGRLDQARTFYEKILKIDPENQDAKKNLTSETRKKRAPVAAVC